MTATAAIPDEKIVTYAKVYSESTRGTVLEQGVFAGWFLATFIVFPGNELVLYPLMMVILAMYVMRFGPCFSLSGRGILLFLVPVLGTISFMWSPFPAQALKQGIFLILTSLTAVVIVDRLTQRKILRCMFLAGIVAVLIAAPKINTFDTGGPYGGKNIFAIQMLYVFLLSIYVALNRQEHVWLRLLALPFIPLTLLFVILAESATANTFAALCIVGMISLRFAWLSISAVQHLRTIGTMLAVVGIIIGVIWIQSNSEGGFMQAFLDLVGKDATFTGRTAIWEAGNIASERHPIWGMGLEAYWQMSNGAAQSVNEYDHKPYGTKLSFHNAYLEVQVHLGYVGLTMFVASVAWCFYRIVKAFFTNPTMERCTFMLAGFMIFVSSFTESYMWATFNTTVYFLFLGAMTTLVPDGKKLVRKVPVILTPNGPERDHSSPVLNY
jgi:exopolysaccharide production protein ExoQ